MRNSARLLRRRDRRVESKTRPGHQQFDLAPVTLDGGADGVRPGEQLHTGAVGAFSSQRLRNVDDRAGLEPEFRQLRGQARRSSRIRLEQDGKRVERLAQLLRVTVCVRRPPASAGSDSRVSATASSIPERHEEFAIGRAMISRHAFPKRNQMSGEIPAIH